MEWMVILLRKLRCWRNNKIAHMFYKCIRTMSGCWNLRECRNMSIWNKTMPDSEMSHLCKLSKLLWWKHQHRMQRCSFGQWWSNGKFKISFWRSRKEKSISSSNFKAQCQCKSPFELDESGECTKCNTLASLRWQCDTVSGDAANKMHYSWTFFVIILTYHFNLNWSFFSPNGSA